MSLREARGYRRRKPLTQIELAKRAEVDQTYVSLIERGLRTPSPDIKQRLAKALGIAPSRLRFAELDLDGESVSPTVDSRGHEAAAEARR